jgi:phosphatidate cytidylyltransferase
MVRVLTAIVLGAAVLAAIWWLPSWGIIALVLLAAAVGLVEYGRMFLADPVERWAAVLAGLAAAVVMVLFPAMPEAVLLVLVLDLFLLAQIFMGRAEDLSGSAGRLAAAIMGIVYLGIAFPYWSLIERLSQGKELVLLALVPACLCDIFAYAAGKGFGRHRMASRISPNKTMEGLIGALAGSLAGTFFIRWLVLPDLPAHHAAVLSLLIWITSPFGDLVESFFKRSSGVKDSGAIIPGHGGVLDRLDALVFTGPAAFAYYKYVMNV